MYIERAELGKFYEDEMEGLRFSVNHIGARRIKRQPAERAPEVPFYGGGRPPVYRLLVGEGCRKGGALAGFADRWYQNRLWGLNGKDLTWMRENMGKEKIENKVEFLREFRRIWRCSGRSTGKGEI